MKHMILLLMMMMMISLEADLNEEPKMTHMGFVSVIVSSEPETICWKIVDAESKEQIFGYSAGAYKKISTHSQFFNIPSGI